MTTDFRNSGHWSYKDMLTLAHLTPPRQPAEIPASSRFDEIFESHADFVWRALRRLGLSSTDAEDALQEVFLVVYRRLEQYEERGTMRAWLFAISQQVANHWRRSAARSERKQRAMLYVQDPTPDDAHAVLERGEAVALVRSLLAELSEPQAAVFWLAEIEEMTMPEVASALGVNLNTAYGRLRLARKRFEQMLRERVERER